MKIITFYCCLLISGGCLLIGGPLMAQVDQAPAYPLITHNPYFSVWSFGDDLTTSTTKHWTGANQPMMGWIKVDGAVYRWMGAAPDTTHFLPGSHCAVPAQQVRLEMRATQTVYQFFCGP